MSKLFLSIAICNQLNAAPYSGGVHCISLGHYYWKRPCQLYTALVNPQFYSLVPSPFPPPVFDSLQYTKTEGNGLEVTFMMAGRHKGRCPIVVTHKPCVDQPRIYRIMSCIDTVFRMLQSQILGQDITGRISRFFVGHCSPHGYPHVYLYHVLFPIGQQPNSDTRKAHITQL